MPRLAGDVQGENLRRWPGDRWCDVGSSTLGCVLQTQVGLQG